MSLSRPDIHKGAVALEQIAACFHELASAADAIVSAQRKLSKALKESASSKGCPRIAKNALSASAWVLDSLNEADSKYARAIEREYETLSADLRKWFKKLAKDEREHDEFVNIRETKIRQAGEAYERRALKKDIAEEYSRYVEILNTLGAEISTAQQQHADEANSRHAAMMTSSGACLARLADASWARTCEALRRSAPGVASVGEARAWCESGWQGDDAEYAQHMEQPLQSETISSRQPPQSPVSESHSSQRPLPTPSPSFRPPSYRSNTAELSVPSNGRPRANSADSSARGKSSLSVEYGKRPESSAPRLPESSTESDLYPDYYNTAAGSGSTRDQDTMSLPNPYDTDTQNLSDQPTVDRSPQPSSAPALEAQQSGPSPSSSAISDQSNWQQQPSPSASHRRTESPRPRSRGPSAENPWGQGAVPVAGDYLMYRSQQQRHRSSTPLSATHDRAPSPSSYHRATSPPDGSYTARSSQYPSSMNHSNQFPAQQRVTSSPVAWARPITPNSPRKPPTWVGKGLRRLSMPTFANNR